MAAVAVLAALAAVALAIVTAWLLVDRRRTCARVDALTAGVDRTARDLAVDDRHRRSTATARSDAADAASRGGARSGRRLHDAGPAAALTRLARSTDHLADLAGLAADLRARSLRALDAIPQGVVICDLTGSVIARNLEASGWVEARHGEALVQVAVDEMLAAAAAGRPDLRTIELLGPPSRTVDLSAMPVVGRGRGRHRRRVRAAPRRRPATRLRGQHQPRDAHAGGRRSRCWPRRCSPRPSCWPTSPPSPSCSAWPRGCYHEALRVGRTIDDLLELTRIEAGEPPARDPVLVADVLAAAIDRTRPPASSAT